MKKKIYMIPVTEVIEVALQHHMLAGSTLSIGASVNSATGAESREADDLWDE